MTRTTDITPAPDLRDELDWVRGAPSDVLRAAVAVSVLGVALVLGWLFDAAVVAAAAQLLDALEALPRWTLDLVALIGSVLLVALFAAGLLVAVTGRHWRLAGSALLGAGLAAVLTSATTQVVDAEIEVLPDSALTLLDGRAPSAALLAATTATVAITMTSLSRWWRRLGWCLVASLAVVRFIDAPVSLDVLVSVLTGWAVGSVVVVLVGAPSQRPRPTSILEGLAAVGVPLVTLSPAAVDARGSTPYFGTSSDGRRYFVKVLGGDERSADLMFRMWRFVQPRNLGDQRPFSSLRRGVEHEALVATMARQFGLRTPPVAGIATAAPNGYVLVYEAIQGRSLDQLPPDEMTDGILEGVWTQLAELRRHRIAHRDLRLANLFLGDDGEVFLIDFGFSELAAEDLLLQTDVAELLASCATVVGVERAVAAAGAMVGPDTLAGASARLVPSRLSGATRAAMQQSSGVLAQLRDAAANSGALGGSPDRSG